jgi:phosphoserine aminotransferase
MRLPMNFNPGPAALPLAALERAREEFLDFAGTGVSVMEHSHRGREYEAVHEQSAALLRELLRIPADYDVLFLQGGASTQFATVPMNFVAPGASADYVVTGAWSDKAYAEASAWGAVGGARARVAASTKETGFARVAVVEGADLDPRAAYVHFASNETVHGLQYATLPRFGGAPQVCDMSSDFMSRTIDVSAFSLLYAGAQKNLGPSGVTVVVSRRDFIETGRRDLPKILQYRAHAAARSLLNTPPTFAIYMVRNVLSWIKESGGVEAMERRNLAKAAELYAALDGSKGFYVCPVEPSSRSVMNVVFRLPSAGLEERFLGEAKKHAMMGLKGHRDVGGIRASLYNAVEPEWVSTLAAFVKDFAERNG